MLHWYIEVGQTAHTMVKRKTKTNNDLQNQNDTQKNLKLSKTKKNI
jgi:hypothetical protein